MDDDRERRPAVAAPNLRLTTGYDFSHVASTRADFFDGITTSTLRIRGTDAHQVKLELAGAMPLSHSTGVRASLRGTWGDMRQNIDLFDPGNEDFDAAIYGGTLEALLRDPDLGSLSIGADLSRLDGNEGNEADQAIGTAAGAIFFPDMGMGAVDWLLSGHYGHRDVKSNPNVFFYGVRGGAAWYVTRYFRIEAAGSYARADNETIVEEDREGHLGLRWLLPLPVSLELSVAGSAGVSEYKEPPFDGDERLVYGASGQLTFRLRSGKTLLEVLRAYD